MLHQPGDAGGHVQRPAPAPAPAARWRAFRPPRLSLSVRARQPPEREGAMRARHCWTMRGEPAANTDSDLAAPRRRRSIVRARRVAGALHIRSTRQRGCCAQPVHRVLPRPTHTPRTVLPTSAQPLRPRMSRGGGRMVLARTGGAADSLGSKVPSTAARPDAWRAAARGAPARSGQNMKLELIAPPTTYLGITNTPSSRMYSYHALTR